MSSDSQDSEGEDLPTLRPTLIHELRNILDLYPDDGQILKELIQNAEDAGASVVKVMSDTRTFNQQHDQQTLKNHPHLKFFKGPALCIYNDAEFSPLDWEGIRMLHKSIKEKDPLKVGRFGLGFKSVFHLTDRLVILSGDRIMYMDPFKGEDRYCNWRLVAGRKGRELQSILHCLEGVFGVSSETFRANTGRFPGTLFWLPLRQIPSDLSRTLYTEQSVQDLLASFRAEASTVLLFLNHLHRVTVLTRDDNRMKEIFSVGITSPCLATVQQKRQQFDSKLKSAGLDLPQHDVFCVTEVQMETRNHLTSTADSQLWLVANYHCGQGTMSSRLSRLCADPQLSYRPFVGVAIPLTDRSHFQSQVFCFLPLPLDTRSPTGLPVHVHGFFAMEQNRRHLKWPTADQLNHRGHVDPSSEWNCLLVEELLPRVYQQAIVRLQELRHNDSDTFYKFWPQEQIVSDRWKLLLKPLYSLLVQKPVFYSSVGSGNWLSLHQIVLQRFDPAVSQTVREAVVKVYTIQGKNLVNLPEHVYQTLKKFDLLRSVPIINAPEVSHLIPNSLLQLTRSEKLSLLHYLYSHDKALLNNLPLMPLADGQSFGTFTQRNKQQATTFWCSNELVQLFPGLEYEFVDYNVPSDIQNDLYHLAKSGMLAMEVLQETDHRIPALLQRSLQVRFGSRQPSLTINDPWLQRVWQFLWKQDNLSTYSNVPLLPLKKTERNALTLFLTNTESTLLLPLDGVYICSCARGMTPLSSVLTSALTKLGVTVLHDLPDYVTRHPGVLGNLVSYPSDEGIMKAVQQVKDSRTYIQVFNSTAAGEEKHAFVQLLSESSGNLKKTTIFFHLKLFTKAITREPASVSEVTYIGPDDLPPISPPVPLLTCSSLEKRAAVKLGAQQFTLEQVVHMVLQQISSDNCQRKDIIEFMKFFLQNQVLMQNSSLLEMAREVQFVETKSGQLKKADDVYDPQSVLLMELFEFQYNNLFPTGELAQPEMLKRLKKLGLRTENNVKQDDLITAAIHISQMWTSGHQLKALKAAEGLWKYLSVYRDTSPKSLLGYVAHIQCLPCLQDAAKPKHYPKSLPIKTTPALVKPSETISSSLICVAGSVMPVMRPEFSECQSLLVIQDISPEMVLQHLQNVVQTFTWAEASQYKSVLCEIFQFLGPRICNHPLIVEQLRETKCVLIEAREQFARPSSFWIYRQEDDIDLKPYRFPIPMEMADMNHFFEECGSSSRQDSQMLLSVLTEIESKYSNTKSSPADFHKDFQLVQQILDALCGSDAVADGHTLVPIEYDQNNVLRFKPAKECTVMSGARRPNEYARLESETYYYVHSGISNRTALGLGALLMKDRALTGVEDLDYGYGQHEDLTNRLHGLLKESYMDGFAVPKELIQNADDAGASKVCFLLDERENLNSRTNLITEAMTSLQGPAIWAYNDAVFSETDFDNIVKLGAGTKKDDVSKVGRFGLGFNAVYNLTDVPCFISRNKLAMFDPQRKYLAKGAGLKLDFTKPINKDLLSRMPEQFQPFQNVFGCCLQNASNVSFQGTLFRFPLRTAEQAADSKLKSESYSETKRREFLKMLLERAGNLLLFTQNVREVQVFHLPSNCSDPAKARCLLTVRKKCAALEIIQPRAKLGDRTILQFMKDHWPKKCTDVKIQQKIEIDMTVTKEAKDVCMVDGGHSVTQWQLAWASGTGISAKLAHLYKYEGLVPLAAVAIAVSENGLMPLKESPGGFYTTGHLYCFLPLPEEMSRITLPVHVNGTFALTSDRRGLLLQTEDDLDSKGSTWNSALYSDAVCRAYLLLLEVVKSQAAMDADFSRYFDLWPTSSIPCLVDNFYMRLESDRNKVVPVPETEEWVTSQEVRFLDPTFRDTKCGKSAWLTLQRFWKGPGYLVDIPSAICKMMEDKGPKGSFQAKVITEFTFYKDFFFPNLDSDWWHPEERDSLTHHALLKDDKAMNELIKANYCIPCEGVEELKRPRDLIHPNGPVANLFLPAEGRFPQKALTDKTVAQVVHTSQKIDFCDYNTLQLLKRLGMITNELPWEMLLDRANSVAKLNEEKNTREVSLSRARHLIDYLSNPTNARSEFAFGNIPDKVKKSLSETAFLPVLSRPEEWSFPWAGEEPSDFKRLAPPAELFSESLMHLVGCKAKVLDGKALHGSVYQTGKVSVLKSLGVVVGEDYSHTQLLQLAGQQLLCIAQLQNSDLKNNRDLARSISSDIYSFLNKCLRRDENDSIRKYIVSSLSDRDVVLTDLGFVRPQLVTFQCQYDCSPFLFRLEESLQRQRDFFEAVGVKARFGDGDILPVLEKLHNDNDSIRLPDDTISLVSRLAQLLGDIVHASADSESVDITRVFLPDSQGFLRPSSHLCVDDCEWLTESEFMKFVHGKIPTDTAQKLGVKNKKRQDYDTGTEAICVESFGQNEKLTTRIKRLLEGYTFDSSLCKELLQNAEDAGATEAMFIMDFRHLGKETVPANWEALQGPALCFYNNKSFTKADIEGIQNLGMGSKAGDAMKIGQFGVGFNAVFHITDVPSFWTREDDQKDVICVFDPNCKYVLNTVPEKPGIKFTNIERFSQAYPDFISGYLTNAIDMNSSGTLFRFPLRTAMMANSYSSEIKNKPVTELEIKDLLINFRKEMNACLLFLNNLQRVGICTVNQNGLLETEFEVKKTIDDFSCKQLRKMKVFLQKMSKKPPVLKSIPTLEVVARSRILGSSGVSEEWLTVHRAGFSSPGQLSQTLQDGWSEGNFKILPRGGVAVKLTSTPPDSKEELLSGKHQVFCTLPLPVHLALPMHVNGHFALDHETRRNLWDSGSQKDDVRSEWNSAIVGQVIVPAYITALLRVKEILFSDKSQICDDKVLKSKLDLYHSLFPQPVKADSPFWKEFVCDIFRELAREPSPPLFPVYCEEKALLEWVPAVRRDGFPGYFSNLPAFFRDKEKENQIPSTVILTQGISSASLPRKSKEDISAKSAKDLQSLLKRLNMKMLESPFSVYQSFKDSGVEAVMEVTPQTVLQFLKSGSQGKQDGCNISSLPKPVVETSLSTVDNVKKLVDFVSNDPEFFVSLDGLPLCMRQSEVLYEFYCSPDTPKPILSKFGHLLHGSSDEFLHKVILEYFPWPEKVQAVLQTLSIPMLASRLSLTLTHPHFRAGQPCPWQQETMPSISWVKDLWKFLAEQIKAKLQEEKEAAEKLKENKESAKLKEKKLEREEVRRKEEEMLQSLSEWCLIPVKKQEVSLLYPIKDMYCVVHLTSAPDQSNGHLWKILREFPLPFLDDLKLLPVNIAQDLVASICHPRALLHALASCADSISASHEIGYSILNYFNNNLAILKNNCSSNIELQAKLRSLPVFPGIDGCLESISAAVPVLGLESDIPQEGLMQWSNCTKPAVRLLRKEFVPTDLHSFLRFEVLSNADFYARYLLPSLNCLPRCAVVTHMDFLRSSFSWNVENQPNQKMDEELKKLVYQLKSTAFIEVAGTLHRAHDFYNPHHDVFKVMCAPESFPPEPYCHIKWKSFVIAAGLIADVTDDMFLEFARAVERDGHKDVTKVVAKKSQTLVEHLFARKSLLESFLLQQVREVRFLLPSDWISTPQGEELAKIAPPFCSVPRLVSFAESCFEGHLHLVWSSSCILHPYCEPQDIFYNHKQLNKVKNILGLQDKAPKNKVIQHARNVCLTLGGDGGRDIIAWFQKKNKRELIYVMERIYGYLQDNASSKADIATLKLLQIICDIDGKQMLKPANVVIDIRPNEMIKGHIEKAPTVFGKFFDFFMKLGAASCVTANHYATVLSGLKEQAQNEIVHVEEMKVVKSAVEGVFRCLREGSDEQKKIATDVLYLPTEEKCLQKSTELIFKDIYVDERFTKPPDGMYFFLGFAKLKIKVLLALEELERLPEQHKIVKLSQIAKEVIPEEIKNDAVEADQSPLAKMLTHPLAKLAIIRLAYHKYRISDRKFGEETARDILQKLADISVKEIFELKTVLTVFNEVISESECKRKAFAELKRDGELREAVVYVSPKAYVNWVKKEEECLDSLCIAVQFVLNIGLDSLLLHRVLRAPVQAMRLLDKCKIAHCSFDSNMLDENVFPQPGTFVSPRDHCHLNNSCYEFYEGEHVGYEVYDSQVEADNLDNPLDDNSDPVYIYGIVLTEIKPDSESFSQLSRRYLIDLGPEKGRLEVNATRLYKFVRRVRNSSSTELALYQGDAPEEDERLPEFKAVLKEIRGLLTEAWQLSDKKDRRRVVMRLLLQWHPDKNPGNEPFCTRVTQAIQNYVHLLETGQPLPSDDDNDFGKNNTDGGWFDGPGSFFHSSFFSNVFERGRRHRSCYDEEVRSGGGGGSRNRRRGCYSQGSNPNPQPGEGHRWFRQAQADVTAARAARGTCDRGHNWICYLCHQAVEKALKAILYCRDSNKLDTQDHNLKYLADCVKDPLLQDLSNQLENRVGPHSRMCYPDVQVYPRVPADVYNATEAEWALQVASQAVDHVQTLIKC